ncbi:MAG: hypothetical protein MJZ24_03725 [Paludibacteraceae bacterium]|nr:hypothetical protein [Paludibacteraceae bacterium]
MNHHFVINTQTTAGKRMQNEMRKRMREHIQRDQILRDKMMSEDDVQRIIADANSETSTDKSEIDKSSEK